MRIDVGARLRTERKAKHLSQADLERRCGLARCRISWLEHGRAVPTLETLERIADALETPVHQLLMDDRDGSAASVFPAEIPTAVPLPPAKNTVCVLADLRTHWKRMSEQDKSLLVFIAEKMAGRCLLSRARGKDRNGNKIKQQGSQAGGQI